MKGVRAGLLISISERYLLAAVALASSILVARILTPEEIGIYSVSVAVIALAQVLRDFGIGSFLVQAEKLTEKLIRTAFGLSLLVGSILFFLVFILSPIAADFYNEPALINTLLISSANFLILPFCSISMSILRREMQFRRIALINIAAACAGAISVVAAATYGAGPNSMAISSIVASLTTGIGTWLARTNHTFLMPSLSEWRDLLKYGSQATVASAVTTLAVNGNDLVLGKVLGFGPVAIFSRAQGLMNLFHRDLMEAVRNVAFPAYAQAHREGLPLEDKYIASVTAITAIAWPFYGMLAIFPLEIVRTLFGTQWDASIPLVPIFALAGAISAMSNLAQPLLVASGRIDLATRAELLVQPIRLAIIATTAVVFESVFSCAIAYLVTMAVATPIFYWFKGLGVKNDIKGLAFGLAKSALVTLGTLIIPAAYAYSAGVNRDTPIRTEELILIVILSIGSWFLSLKHSRHLLIDEISIKFKN